MLRTATTALAALCIAAPIAAQDLPSPKYRPSKDAVELRASEDAYAELHYDNSANLSSVPVDREYVFEGLTVRVVISVTHRAEKIWIYPSAGFAADIEYAEVLDGETITIPIRYAMF